MQISRANRLHNNTVNVTIRIYIRTFSVALFAKVQLLSGKPQLKQQPSGGDRRRRLFSRTTTSFSRHTIWPTGPRGSSAKKVQGVDESRRHQQEVVAQKWKKCFFKSSLKAICARKKFSWVKKEKVTSFCLLFTWMHLPGQINAIVVQKHHIKEFCSTENLWRISLNWLYEERAIKTAIPRSQQAEALSYGGACILDSRGCIMCVCTCVFAYQDEGARECKRDCNCACNWPIHAGRGRNHYIL